MHRFIFLSTLGSYLLSRGCICMILLDWLLLINYRLILLPVMIGKVNGKSRQCDKR